MELRKNITQGSLWFAVTTLSFLGIVRCHTQAQNAKSIGITLGPEVDTGIQNHDSQRFKYSHSEKYKRQNSWGDQEKYGDQDWKSRSSDRKFGPKNYRNNSAQRFGARENKTQEQWNQWKKGKPLQPKLALDLLLALRNSQNKKSLLQLSQDSLRLQRELFSTLKKQNPFPNRLDWNSLDSGAWENLAGIGPSTARRIVKYRDKLGGFAIAEQILEVPKIDSLLAIVLIQSWSVPEKSPIKINTTPAWKQLYAHPYVGPSKAKILHPFFVQHPTITHTQWQNLQGLTTVEKEKLLPYIGFLDKE